MIGAMKSTILIGVMLLTSLAFGKKDSTVDSRKEFANLYQQGLEQEGWPETVVVSGKSKDVLQIWMPNAAVDMVYQFEKQLIEPYKTKIKSAGFQSVEIKTDVFSASFPKGVWDIGLD